MESEPVNVPPVLAPSASKAYVPCEGEDCLIVPEGIIGMVFGMTTENLEERFGRLKRVRLPERAVTASAGCAEKRRPPYDRFRATTTIGEEPTVCDLDVASTGLVAIRCTLDGKRERDDHAAIANVLYRSLAKKYGEATRAREDLVTSGTLDAEWLTDKARLAVRASHRGTRSKIAVENESPRQTEALNNETAEVARGCQERAAERAAEAEAREAALREKARKFEEDLAPPLERPR